MFIKRLKYLFLSLFFVLTSSVVFVPVMVGAAAAPVAAPSSFQGDACAGVNALDNNGTTTCSDSGSAVNRLIRLVLDILSLVVGVTAVIMVIIGGFKYITSNGDSSNLTSARNTILYAIVGLVIVATSQVLVHFVLANVSNTSTVCTTTANTKNCTVQLCKTAGQKDCTVKK